MLFRLEHDVLTGLTVRIEQILISNGEVEIVIDAGDAIPDGFEISQKSEAPLG
jgi:hypothetical protein